MKTPQSLPPDSGDPAGLGKVDPRLLSELQRRTPYVGGGRGATMHHLPGGAIMTPEAPLPSPDYILPFHPLGYVSDGTNTNVWIKPAYVVEYHVEHRDPVTGEGGIEIVEPLIGGVSLWQVEPPALTLASNKSYNYLTVNTNPLGFPTQDWNVVSHTNIQNTVHHIPPDPEDSAGTNGIYYIEIFRTDLDNADPNEKIKTKWGGHYPHHQALWSGTHPDASGALPFARYDETFNRYHFRSHVSAHGHNATQISNTIDHSFYGTNVGGVSTGSGNVYQQNRNERLAKFNAIRERVTNPQVRVTQSSNTAPIFIEGNGVDATITFQDCNSNPVATLTFVDGLLTSPAGATSIPLGNCT